MSDTSSRGGIKVLAALSIGLLSAIFGNAKPLFSAEPSPVTAIDILLEPDAAMLRRAEADNDKLLKVFSKGFALDANHRPHITLVQRFVRTDNLEKVYAALETVFAAANVASMKLEAYKYYYTPGDRVGVAGIVTRPTSQLLKLQQEVIAAVAPYTVEIGQIGAFTAPHDNPADDAILIGIVSTFVPKQTGEHFNPHVSIGVAPRDYLDKMVTEPFEALTFSPARAAVYQLGPYGTAAKSLKEWK
jgi:hypothetical protein